MILADGMGSGSQAHADAALTVTLLKGFLEAGRSPRSALEETGRIIREQTGGERPAAADLLILKADGRFLLLKAGGAPSYLIAPDGLKQMRSACPPLGAPVEHLPTSFSGRLKEWETVLLCSDGFVPPAPLLLETARLPRSQWRSRLEAASDPAADDFSSAVCGPAPTPSGPERKSGGRVAISEKDGIIPQ